MEDSIVNPKKLSLDNIEPTLRPLGFNDFVGQVSAKDKLKVFIESAKKREEALDHILFSGPPGLGKTTLAQIIANELGCNIKSTSAPIIERAGDLASILTSLNEKDILFIDEIHRLKTIVEEVLYSAMEDFFVDVKVGEGVSAKSYRVPLPKFTLIGATTRSGLLSSPLYDRFGIVERLEFYNDKELSLIAMRSAKYFEIEFDDKASLMVAKRSRGTPRIVNRLVRRIRDFAVVEDLKIIDENFVDNALTKLGVDEFGLEQLDKQYITTIIKHYGGGPVGANTLSVSLSEEVETIEDVIEPYLIQIGFIKRSPKGRIATKKSYDYLKIDMINNADGFLFD